MRLYWLTDTTWIDLDAVVAVVAKHDAVLPSGGRGACVRLFLLGGQELTVPREDEGSADWLTRYLAEMAERPS